MICSGLISADGGDGNLNMVGLRQQRLRNRLARYAANDICASYGGADQCAKP